MTVCIAAIYGNNAVLGASDRMITAGGSIEFEPSQPKIWQLTTSITAMVADDILVHTELYHNVSRIVYDRIAKEPQNWWRVSDVAELYSQSYSQLRLRGALKEVLEPLGLDFNSFINKQKEMSADFIKRVESKLAAYKIASVSTILAGVDSEGPHIYKVDNEIDSCHDRIGFAVIGIGAYHAAPHFMFSGHTPGNSGTRTLLVAHQAKKKSEVAPGVGEGTDMFIIGPQLGSFNWIERAWIKKLDKIYEEHLKDTEKLNKKPEKALEKFIKKQVEARKKLEQKIKPPTIDTNKVEPKTVDSAIKKIEESGNSPESASP